MTAAFRRNTGDAPLVSVVVPAFNASVTLRDALDSLRAQTVENIEVIVVDDGSNDETNAIARAFVEGDARFTVVTQSNQGVSVARNMGISLARGTWIAFLDADDTVLPEYLEGMLAGAIDGVDMVCGGVIEASANPTCSNVRGHGRSLVLTGEEARHMAESILDNEAHGIDGYCPHVSGYAGGKLYRASAVAGVFFNTLLGMREDALFNIEAISRSRSVSLVPEYGYVYRLREESASNGFREDYRKEVGLFLSACQEVWSRLNLDPLSLDKGKLIAYMSWLKLHVLHESAPYSKRERNRLVRSSFDDPLWAGPFARTPYGSLNAPYRLLKRAYLARSVYAIRALKQINDIKKRAL